MTSTHISAGIFPRIFCPLRSFHSNIRLRFASAITVEMIYGRKIVDDDDEFTRVAEEGDVVASTMSKVAILDLFPSRTYSS